MRSSSVIVQPGIGTRFCNLCDVGYLKFQMEKSMLNKTRIALSVAVGLANASCAFAASMQVANNHASQYGSPDSTPNGPFLNVDTYGAPPAAKRQGHQPQRLLHRRN
jgi:hypothetical protein